MVLLKESEVAQLCPTLCDPMDCSLPGSSIYGILQARILEWVTISFSRGSSQPPGIEPGSPTLEADALTSEPPEKPPMVVLLACNYTVIIVISCLKSDSHWIITS